MVDQQRFDTIAALGNKHIYTPNLDRLVRRGIAFTNAYAPCPVCVPSRYSIRTGCAPPTTAVYGNSAPHPAPDQAPTMTGRCGPYLAQTMKTLGYRTFLPAFLWVAVAEKHRAFKNHHSELKTPANAIPRQPLHND